MNDQIGDFPHARSTPRQFQSTAGFWADRANVSMLDALDDKNPINAFFALAMALVSLAMFFAGQYEPSKSDDERR